jgi:RND superfamily putative drug exporter
MFVTSSPTPANDPPTRVLGRLAALVAGPLRYLVVLAWIGIAAAVTLYLPTLGTDQGDLGIPVPDDAPALQAEARSAELFGYPLISRTLVVQRDPAGLSARDRAQLAERVLDVNRRRDPALGEIAAAVPLVDDLGLAASPGEEGTTAVTYLFFRPDASIALAETVAGRFAASLRAGQGTLSGVTGVGPARNQQFELIQDRIGWVVLATLATICLIVWLVFRSLVAPLLTLATAAVAYLVDLRVIAWVGEQTGIPASADLEPVVAALLLGIVTDYSLFYLFGVRNRLEAGDAPPDAARWAAARYAPIVATAGFTVAAGTASLLVGGIDFFRSFGPGLAVTALIGMAVAITLVPALLSIVGGRVARSRRRPAEAIERAPLSLRLISRRPVAALAALVTVALLLAAASGLRETTLGSGLTSGLPRDAAARAAADAIDAGFPPGVRGPTELLLEGPGVAADPAALTRLEQELRSQPGVSAVVGPGAPIQQTPLADVLQTPDGNAARMLLVLRDDPTEHKAIATLRRIEARLPGLLQQAGLGGAQAALAGDSALAAATIDATTGELLRVGIVAALVNLVLLSLFLRAVLAPLYLLAASALSVAASLGLATYVFQDLLGQGQLVYYVPFATAVLLLALGSDYNIFLVGQVWDEAADGGLAAAVRRAGGRSGATIAVAGLVLAASFALLAIVPLDALRQFAFVMGAGVLIDAFVVRSVLVPALIVLFGDAGRWPGRARGSSRGDAPRVAIAAEAE